MPTPPTSPPPTRRAFLTAEWRWLLMLNYEVPPATLAPLVPRGTTLDLFEGRARASIVAFRFLRTRVLGVPVPGHVDFDEVNLRFYVRHETPAGELRRGAVFVRELVPRAAIAWLARVAYNEPYAALPMRSAVPAVMGDAPGRATFEWRVGSRWMHAAGTATGTPTLPPRGSEAEFITEHYWGYTPQRDGGTVEYQVTHPRWRTWDATEVAFDADVAALYGPAFVAPLSAPPTSAFIAEGSPVAVHMPRRLRDERVGPRGR
jgi:uncharacterized protein YqjF (DUF2071 family)